MIAMQAGGNTIDLLTDLPPSEPLRPRVKHEGFGIRILRDIGLQNLYEMGWTFPVSPDFATFPRNATPKRGAYAFD
ncbi:MAG: hypothetical protein ACKODB_03625 [Betaproteobacteria bacterium]